MIKTLLFLLLVALIAYVNADIFKFCNGDQSGYTLQVSSLSCDPNPPKSGANFDVFLRGTLGKALGKGTAKVHVEYAGVELYDGTLDFCSFAASTIKCPLSPGPQNITIHQVIPGEAPPGGPYTGTIDIKDQSNLQVTCINFEFDMQ
jgi:hypothetical protein